MVRRLMGHWSWSAPSSLALALAACGNASAATSTTLKAGVRICLRTGPGARRHDQRDHVGTLATESGALAPGFGEIVNGVQAYFDLVNAARRGQRPQDRPQVQGRRPASTTNDETQARNLVEQDHVFAVVGVGTPFFTGSTFLAQTRHADLRVRGHPGLEQSPEPLRCLRLLPRLQHRSARLRYMPQQLHAKSVAVLAYNFGPHRKTLCRTWPRD